MPAPRNPMEIREARNIIGTAYKDPYFIVMTDGFIQIFNAKDG